MGVNDRDWMREDPCRQSVQASFSVVPLIIILCGAVFLLGMLWQIPSPLGKQMISASQYYGAYIFALCFGEGDYWQLISYQFVHANVGHIVFNMFALWVFGKSVERVLGWKHFVCFYFSCGIFAALFSSFCSWIGLFAQPFYIGEWIPMVGASGSIYGAIAASAILFPRERIALLFPPVEMSVRTLALVVLGIACVVILLGWDNAGGEAGHLGGMIFGFIWISCFRFFNRSLMGGKA